MRACLCVQVVLMVLIVRYYIPSVLREKKKKIKKMHVMGSSCTLYALLLPNNNSNENL